MTREEKIKDIAWSLFDIKYDFDGYSDNHYDYFKFREYKIKLSIAKDYLCLTKNGKTIIDGTWQEVKIIEQIGKIFVGNSHFIGDEPKV